MKTDITYGNAFRALGFAEPEASNLQTRSELMIEIQSIIETEALTQKEAALRFGTSQPRISALLKGRVDKFTVDALMNMLSHAGMPVAVVTRDKIRALPTTTTQGDECHFSAESAIGLWCTGLALTIDADPVPLKRGPCPRPRSPRLLGGRPEYWAFVRRAEKRKAKAKGKT